MSPDLTLAFHLADLADAMTLRWWSRNGVASTAKADGSLVTEADVAAEEAVLSAVREARPGDGFLGEEVGERMGTTGRRWIVDGIDGTRFFAAGLARWGSLIALEVAGEIVLGVTSSPAQDRRWWATRGEGAFTGRSKSRSTDIRIHVSTERRLRPDRFITLPAHGALPLHRQQIVEELGGGPPVDRPWSHANRIAEGRADVCVWFCGDIWDHAAPSILVEEAGGRFSDHSQTRKAPDTGLHDTFASNTSAFSDAWYRTFAENRSMRPRVAPV
ncbi:histidinol-phosphatase [soil metagenome]